LDGFDVHSGSFARIVRPLRPHRHQAWV